jgi:hypothetical protein
VPTKHSTGSSSAITGGLAPSEVVIGTLVAVDSDGRALVSFSLDEYVMEYVPALSTQVVDNQSVGRQVALLFAAGNQQQPVVMGFIHSPLDLAIGQTQAHSAQEHNSAITETELFTGPPQFVAPERAANLDGKRLVFEAEEEVQIKCGEASINLYKDGRVVIRGRNLISRASVVNRILGGSVQVN